MLDLYFVKLHVSKMFDNTCIHVCSAIIHMVIIIVQYAIKQIVVYFR